MDASAIIPVLEHLENMTLNFINTIEIMKLLRPKNRGVIFESTKFNLKIIVRPTTVWQPFLICVRDKK